MQYIERLNFGFKRSVPLLLQNEAAECGLACLGMIGNHYGYRADLAYLRGQYPVSQRGANLAQIMTIASHMNLGTRPLRVPLEELRHMRFPCILHWNFNHFVVAERVTKNYVVINDPAIGVRRVPMAEVSKSFTGVILEVWPDSEFKKEQVSQKLSFRSLLGSFDGLARSCGQILLLALSIEVIGILSPFFLQWTIDEAIPAADLNLLLMLVIGFSLLVLIQHAIGAARSWMVMTMGTLIGIQWRANAFAHLLRLPTQYFEKRHLGDVTSRFGSIDQIQRTLTSSFLEAILDGFMSIATLMMMFVYSTTLGLVAVGAVCLYTLIRFMWYRPLRTATEEQIIHASKQQSNFFETVRGVKTIKLFERQEQRRSVWLGLLIDQTNAELRGQKLQILYRLVNNMVYGLENIIILGLGAKMVIDGNFTVGALMAFHAYRLQFDARVTALIDKLFELRMLQLQGERLADILLSEREEVEGKRASRLSGANDLSIDVVDLSYRYSPQEPYVLKDVNVSFKAGESVAIIGPSGCGKTTLLAVLLGILQPTTGDVLIGGVSIKTAGVSCLRQMVGTVLQDDVLFAGSIAENISFFDPAPDQAWIEQCAYMASIAVEISNMPMGYATLVGDLGSGLSGGQKQRILLARALYKRPQILFLDEATSHLDLDTEKRVNMAIKKLHITRVIVAHRPETIASADHIVDLRDCQARGSMSDHHLGAVASS